MKIKILVSCVGTDFSYGKGKEVYCNTEALIERAKDLIRGGHAVLMDGVAKPQPETPEQRFKKPEQRKK